ncbi:MAG: hypothetical protein ACSW8F_02480, partial [bacterium]
TRSTVITADRGSIYDTNGNVLAISATAYDIIFNPKLMYEYGEDFSHISSLLTTYCGADLATLSEKAQNHNLQYYLVYRRMDEDSENYQTLRKLVTSYVGTKPDGKEYKGLRAIQFQENSKRYYPYGDLASHLIGFTGTDNNGLNGIEALYDDYLTG